jgi:ABC-type oligopeptide transport system substrate-binding subunit
MKRASLLLLFILALSAFLFTTALAQEKTKTAKKRVAVFNFEDKTEHQWHW